MMRRWVPVVLLFGALWAATGLWGYYQFSGRAKLQTHVGNIYQRNFYNLVNHVENMEVIMAKSLASASPRKNIVNLSKLWREANQAQSNLTDLPFAQSLIHRTAQFLSQAGDFGFRMAEKNARGMSMSESDRAKLRQLHREAGYLASELQDIEVQARDARINWGDIRGRGRDDIKEASDKLGDGIKGVDKQMLEYPTLIYDGPFSDSVINRQPTGITGVQVTRDKAREIAERYLDLRDRDGVRIKNAGESRGMIPTYGFAAGNGTEQEADDVRIDVTKKGGHVYWMINPRDVTERRISVEEAVDYAEKYLESCGIRNMVPTYSSREDNTAVIPFVLRQDDVIIYPDMVKVKVALDNGQVVGYDASAYLSNHKSRKIPEVKVTKEEVTNLVNSELEIESSRLTLIPLETAQESLCWEFRCKLNNETFLIYINAVTGDEERILKVIDSPDGTFTF